MTFILQDNMIKTSSNGNSGGINGVSYEDLNMQQILPCISQYNECNVNHGLSCHWKEAIILRISKKNFNIEDQSTLRVMYRCFPFVTKYYLKPFTVELFQ